jgi:hypothetical protein
MPFALPRKSTPGHNLDDLEPIAGLEPAVREFRWRHGLTIKFDHDTAGQEIFCEKEFLERAGEPGFRGLAVGDEMRKIHNAQPGEIPLDSGRQGRIPIFPDRFVSEATDQAGDLLR